MRGNSTNKGREARGSWRPLSRELVDREELVDFKQGSGIIRFAFFKETLLRWKEKIQGLREEMVRSH